MIDPPRWSTRAPWWGADLQTLRNALVGSPPELPANHSTRIALPLLDESGDILSGLLNEPTAGVSSEAKALVILIHGLSGSEESAYMLISTGYWLSRGHRVLRLNLRGAGPSRPTCRQQYHAGRSEDLRDVLSSLPARLTADGLLLMGYSLGGNMLLKFLAEYGEPFPILAAASVSAPIDLAAASARFLDARNWVYHKHLLGNMKRECFDGPVEITAEERKTILACRSILEFDERVVAPRNGYADAAHYYRENHARRFLAEIKIPTLVIHALNDPWIPSHAYTSYAWQDNPSLHPVLAKSGGHVGFHARGSTTPFYDHCLGSFVDTESDKNR